MMSKALSLAEEYGLPVFPCKPDKAPYTPHGLKDASRNIDQIVEWWGQWPDALVGVPAGPDSRLLVVDIDAAGQQWYRDHFQSLAACRIHKTRRGGYHVLYRYPTDTEIRNSAGKLALGVDVRGAGGFIVWWPASGCETVGDLDDIGPAPGWLLDRLTVKTNGHVSTFTEGTIGEGGRNEFLSREAFRLRKQGSNVNQIALVLRALNMARCSPPLPDGEVNQIAVGKAAVSTEGMVETTEKRVIKAPINWLELEDREPPPRTWWLQDWFSPAPMLVAGRGGAGKTTLVLTALTALVTGKLFIAEPARDLRVLAWCCEETEDDLWRLQCAINRYLDVRMADLAGRLHVVSRVGCENTLLSLTYGVPTVTPMFHELREQVNDLKVDIVVLDNIAQVYGGSGADPHQVTMFVNALAGLVTERPFAPVLLGHIAKSQGSEFSGPMAWENACRMRWYIGSTLPDQKPEDETAEDGSDLVYLAKRKANYTAKDWRRFRFENGLFVPTEAAGRFDQAFRNECADDLVLAAIGKLNAMGVTVTDGNTSRDYLPAQILAKRLAGNHSKRELESAMHRLMTAGKLKRGIVGRYGNRSPKHGLTLA